MSHYKNKSGPTRTALKWLRLKLLPQAKINEEDGWLPPPKVNVNISFKGKDVQDLTDEEFEKMKQNIMKKLKGHEYRFPILYGEYHIGTGTNPTDTKEIIEEKPKDLKRSIIV